MSDQLKESLSAAMDDEATEFELKRALDEARDNPELVAMWERMHAVRDALMGERISPAHDGALRDKVWAELSGVEEPALVDPAGLPEPIAEQREPSSRKPWWGPVAGLGVAATVAFVVVASTGVLTGPEGLEDAGTPSVASIEIQGPEVTLGRLGETVSPADLRRTNAYMIRHVQTRAMNRTGALSFVKMATYGAPADPPPGQNTRPVPTQSPVEATAP